MSTIDTAQDNIVFMEGKALGIQKMLSQDQGCFGYVALGYCPEDESNGFTNVDPDDETSTNGFREISLETDDSTYKRVPLTPFEDPYYNKDNGEVTVKFMCEFNVDNIVSNIPFNQIAIVDTQDPNDTATKFYAASVYHGNIPKSETISMVFIIEVTF